MFEQLDIFTVGTFEEQEEDINKIHLTTRQWKTYNLIKSNSMWGRTTTQREIVDNYSSDNYKEGYVWNENPRVHDHCSTIWQDVNKINAEYNIHKIIIWDDNYNYKIAENPEEVEKFCKELYWEKAMAKLWRYSNLLRKVERDGQYRIFFKDKTKAREYWQTFLDKRLDDLVEMSMKEMEKESEK